MGKFQQFHSVSRVLAWAVTLASASLAGAVEVGEQVPSSVAALERARQIDVGAFCLLDLPPNSVEVGRSRPTPSGIWWEVTIRIDRSSRGSSPARALFYETHRPTSLSFEECADSEDLLLGGVLNEATIDALYLPPEGGQPARWQVEPDEMNVELGHVTTRFRPLFGGRFEPLGRLLWVTNPSRVLVTPSAPQQGVLRIAATDVEITGAKIELGGNLPELIADLAIGYTQGRAELDFDLASGGLSLTGGHFSTKDVPLSAGTWSGAGLELEVESGSIRILSLRGSSQGVQMLVEGVELSAPRIKHSRPMAVATLSAEIEIDEVAGKVPPSEEVARLDEPRWSGAVFRADSLVLMNSADGVSIAGPAQVRVDALDGESFRGSLTFAAPEVPLLEVALEGLGLEKLTLDFEGPKVAPRLSGHSLLANLPLGVLAFDALRDASLSYSSALTTGEASVFEFDLPAGAASGHLALVLPDDREVIIEGGVELSRLKGFFHAGSMEAGPKIVIAPQGLQALVRAQASVRPLLFGSPAQFGSGELSVSAPEGFEVTSGRSAGFVDLAVQSLILPSPAMAFHDVGEGFSIQAPLRLEADAVLRLDLETSAPSLHRGSLLVERLAGRSETDEPVRAGGLLLMAPDVAVERLALEVTGGQGFITGEGLRFGASQVEHLGEPYWKVSLSEPLEVRRFEAALGTSHSTLGMRDLRLLDSGFAASEGVFRAPDGFTVQGQGARVEFATLADDEFDGRIRIGSGQVDLDVRQPNSSVRLTTGFKEFETVALRRQEELSGTGRITLSDLSVVVGSQLEIGKCPPADRWRIRTILDAGRVDLDFELAQDGIHGNVVVPSADVRAEEEAYARCEWDETHRLIEPKWVIFDVPCGLDGWKIKMCRVKERTSPPVDVTLHWVAELHDLQFSSQVRDLRVEAVGSGGVRVCPGEVLFNPPLIAANYHPNIRDDNPFANLIRDLIRGAATIFESSIATAIGSQAAITNLLRETLASPQCYGV